MFGSAIGSVEDIMSVESIVMLLICVGMMIYLLYALLRPEKF
jgi:K+-transporting ATPase KdpF subunit